MKRAVLSVALILGLGLAQARETAPRKAKDKRASETASVKNASETACPERATNTFIFIAPGEGRYLYMFNEAFPEDNNVIFKWSPKTSGAVLLIKSGDEVLDEIRVKNTDRIKLCLSKYSSHKSLTWVLTVSESDEVMQGSINLKKFLPPLYLDVR